LAGVHRNVIGRIERGIFNPSILALRAIAGMLDIPLHELFVTAAHGS